MLFQKYIFGDTAAYYVRSPEFGAGLALLPADIPVEDVDALCCDGMVQVALRCARNLVDYTQGVTMRNRSSSLLAIESQKKEENRVVTQLSDGCGNEYGHMLEYDAETGVISISVEYRNRTQEDQVLESLQSFSVGGIFNPSKKRYTDEGLRLVRMTSAWSRECRLKEEEFCDLGMDMSWARYGVRCERFGQAGTMPNRGWFPFAAVRDEESLFLPPCSKLRTAGRWNCTKRGRPVLSRADWRTMNSAIGAKGSRRGRASAPIAPFCACGTET